MTTSKAKSYAAQNASSPLAPFEIVRREVGAGDIQLDILFCGVCHSDLHQARSEWPGTVYPCVPGHEIIGRVVRTGGQVTKFKVGDLAGVGCMVDSCRTCSSCKAGNEQYCLSFPVLTYNGPDKVLGGATLRRLLEQHRRRPGLRAAHPAEARPGRRRSAAVRRHHHLFAAAPLEGRRGPEGGHRGPGRPRPHGREVRPGARRTRRALHHLARQGQGRGAPRGPRGRDLEERGGDEEAPGQLRLHPRRRLRPARHQRLPEPAQAGRNPGDGGRAGAPACPSPSSTCSCLAATSPAPPSAGSRRPRRCSTSAPSTGSRPTSSSSPSSRSTKPGLACSSRTSATASSIDMASLKGATS